MGNRLPATVLLTLADSTGASMQVTGLSAQAVAWVYAHRSRIEAEAAKVGES